MTKAPHYALKAVICEGMPKKLSKCKYHPKDFQITSSLHIADGKMLSLFLPQPLGRHWFLPCPHYPWTSLKSGKILKIPQLASLFSVEEPTVLRGNGVLKDRKLRAGIL
jgi:hypothetical protein